jgi:hypothetical protein
MNTTQADPTSINITAPEAVISQVKQDVDIGKQAAALIAKKDYISLVKLAYENKALIEKQVEEVEQAIPFIKAGWKTSEFWVMVCYFGLNVYCVYKGINIPVGDDASVGAAVLSYVAGRHYIKAKQ